MISYIDIIVKFSLHLALLSSEFERNSRVRSNGQSSRSIGTWNENVNIGEYQTGTKMTPSSFCTRYHMRFNDRDGAFTPFLIPAPVCEQSVTADLTSVTF